MQQPAKPSPDKNRDANRTLCVTAAALSEKEAAAYIGMSVPYLRCDRVNGHREGRTPGPPFVKIGRTVRYLKVDLDAWLDSHRVVRRTAGEG